MPFIVSRNWPWVQGKFGIGKLVIRPHVLPGLTYPFQRTHIPLSVLTSAEATTNWTLSILTADNGLSLHTKSSPPLSQ